MLEYLYGFVLVDRSEGKADMDEHVLVDLRLGHKGEVDLLDDAAKINGRPATADRLLRGLESVPEPLSTLRFSRFFDPRGPRGLTECEPAVARPPRNAPHVTLQRPSR